MQGLGRAGDYMQAGKPKAGHVVHAIMCGTRSTNTMCSTFRSVIQLRFTLQSFLIKAFVSGVLVFVPVHVIQLSLAVPTDTQSPRTRTT